MPTLVEINCALNRGSTGKIAEQIGLLAERNGWKVYMVCGSPKHQVQSKLKHIQVVGKCQEYWHAIMTRLFDLHGLVNTCSTKRLVQQLKGIKPDIVHIHNLHGYYINYEVLFKYLRDADCKVVWTLHDCWSFTGHCSHFELIGCDRWKTGCFSCPQKREYPASVFLDRSKHNYRLKSELFTSVRNLTLVPVSDWLYDLLKYSFFANKRNIKFNTIHNGVDLDVFKPLTSSLSNALECNALQRTFSGKIVVLSVANRWTDLKGWTDMIELRLRLSNRYSIVMVGVNEKQIATLPEGIIGVKRTNSQIELVALYSLADVFVNPTYADTFPTTNLEALACGTPVVTYKTGGSPEIIDETTGLVVEKGDYDSLAKACMKITPKTDEMSRACRGRAELLYCKEERFEDYIRLYNHLLGINENINCNNLLEQ